MVNIDLLKALTPQDEDKVMVQNVPSADLDDRSFIQYF